jgi:hypothetical protein
MKRIATLLFALTLAATAAHAEFRRVEMTVFGMD